LPEIVWDFPGRPAWVPSLDRIHMSDEPYFKERGPMIFAHELGHREYDQTLGGTDPLVDMFEERDAWRFALSKLPPDEIDVEFLNDSLNSYVQEVEDWYGKGKELDTAKRLSSEIITLAWRKKGVA